MIGIQQETLDKYKENFQADPKNRLAQNVCSKQDLWDVCKNPAVIAGTPHVYNCKVCNVINHAFQSLLNISEV